MNGKQNILVLYIGFAAISIAVSVRNRKKNNQFERKSKGCSIVISLTTVGFCLFVGFFIVVRMLLGVTTISFALPVDICSSLCDSKTDYFLEILFWKVLHFYHNNQNSPEINQNFHYFLYKFSLFNLFKFFRKRWSTSIH